MQVAVTVSRTDLYASAYTSRRHYALSVSCDLKRHLENLAASRPTDQSPRRFRFMPIYGKSCESAWWEKPARTSPCSSWGVAPADRHVTFNATLRITSDKTNWWPSLFLARAKIFAIPSEIRQRNEKCVENDATLSGRAGTRKNSLALGMPTTPPSWTSPRDVTWREAARYRLTSRSSQVRPAAQSSPIFRSQRLQCPHRAANHRLDESLLLIRLRGSKRKTLRLIQRKQVSSKTRVTGRVLSPRIGAVSLGTKSVVHVRQVFSRVICVDIKTPPWQGVALSNVTRSSRNVKCKMISNLLFAFKDAQRDTAPGWSTGCRRRRKWSPGVRIRRRDRWLRRDDAPDSLLIAQRHVESPLLTYTFSRLTVIYMIRRQWRLRRREFHSTRSREMCRSRESGSPF